ncbi:hypothetical protein SAMN04488245_101183 [Alloyangia pacifica]|uniref:Uncharacterized protein n=1 Tax=Alloyangia pacifica TaxID=311180 RepID=A0A1I6QN18_9RHOB|nr:hypothetical protein SAMN04488245_101183 [Alloyangia pacifica]SFS53846.1 hypothetical protein SAMN04488050_102184 [Alloyangia pacifica]
MGRAGGAARSARRQDFVEAAAAACRALGTAARARAVSMTLGVLSCRAHRPCPSQAVAPLGRRPASACRGHNSARSASAFSAPWRLLLPLSVPGPSVRPHQPAPVGRVSKPSTGVMAPCHQCLERASACGAAAAHCLEAEARRGHRGQPKVDGGPRPSFSRKALLPVPKSAWPTQTSPSSAVAKRASWSSGRGPWRARARGVRADRRGTVRAALAGATAGTPPRMQLDAVAAAAVGGEPEAVIEARAILFMRKFLGRSPAPALRFARGRSPGAARFTRPARRRPRSPVPAAPALRRPAPARAGPAPVPPSQRCRTAVRNRARRHGWRRR